jgi:hypothetical protein
MALVLFIADKTPLAVGVMVACIAGLLVYPIIHFISSWAVRVPVLIATLVLVGLFGWRSWPKPANPPPIIAPANPAPPTINQTATDSDCANLIAGSDARIKCEAEKENRRDKDKAAH